MQAKFRQEIDLLKACTHGNVVGFRAACLDAPGHLMLVMEVSSWSSSKPGPCTHSGTDVMNAAAAWCHCAWPGRTLSEHLWLHACSCYMAGTYAQHSRAILQAACCGTSGESGTCKPCDAGCLSVVVIPGDLRARFSQLQP